MKLRYRIGVVGLLAVLSTGAAAPSFAADVKPMAPLTNSPLADNENCSDLSQFLAGNKLCSSADLVLGVKKAPAPQSPTGDVGDYFTSLRPEAAPTGSPFDEGGPTMFASSGLGGFLVSNYDLPGTDDVLGSAEAVGNTSTANFIENISVSITGATAVIERYAFNPTDLTAFLAKFTTTAMELVRAKVWLPYIGLGLLAATCIALLNSGVRGKTRDALWATTWSVIILGAAGIFMLQASNIQSYAQSAVTTTIGSFNQTVDAGGIDGSITSDNLSAYGQNSHGVILTNPSRMSDVMTDAQLRQIHWQGWCRREFGSTETAIVRDYCAKMWDAQRFTYAEQARIDADQSADGAVRKAIVEGKANNWAKWAAEIQAKDSSAYSCMQGIGCNRTWNAITELGFTIFASMFRIFAALMILVSGAVFIGYAITFVVTSPYTVIAKLGQDFAMDLIGGAFKCFAYALMAGIGTWFFMLWAQMALQPGVSTGWSFALMVVGSVVAWGLLRPDRKILNLISFGKVKGQGKHALHLADRLATFLAGKYIADNAADTVVAGRNDRPGQQTYERSEDFRHTPTTNYVPYIAPAAIENVHDGVVMNKEIAPEIQHSPDVYEPTIITGEVITTPFTPETSDYDGTTDVALYDPAMDTDREGADA